MFNIKSKKSMLGVLTLSASIVLAGCQAGGGFGKNKDVDPRLTSGKQAEFFSKSGLQACAIGAAVGTLGCALSNSGNKVACAAVAAIAACGILMGTNYYLEQQRTNYANKEERLNAYLKDIKENTAEVQDLTKVAKSVLSDDRNKIAAINKQLKAGKLQKEQAQAQLKTVDKNLAYLQDKLKKIKESEANWVSVSQQERGDGMKTKQLDTQITKYQKEIKVLESQIALVSKDRNSLKLG